MSNIQHRTRNALKQSATAPDANKRGECCSNAGVGGFGLRYIYFVLVTVVHDFR